jgi:hypothetical protein
VKKSWWLAAVLPRILRLTQAGAVGINPESNSDNAVISQDLSDVMFPAADPPMSD